MEYLRVRWIHPLSNEPVLLLSELDSDRYEVRKIEVFRDGRMGFASEAESAHGSRLGEAAVPPANEIAADPEFLIQSTSAEEFENAWRAAKAGENWSVLDPTRMSASPYPEQVDCIWLAVDRAGHVAAFATAGVGPIPRSVLEEVHTLRALELQVVDLPRVSAARLLVSYKRPDDFIGFAERGIFAYDWTDVHRTQLNQIGAYELVAVPANPLGIADLPQPIAVQALKSKLEGTAFAGANLLDIRRLLSCVEGQPACRAR